MRSVVVLAMHAIAIFNILLRTLQWAARWTLTKIGDEAENQKHLNIVVRKRNPARPQCCKPTLALTAHKTAVTFVTVKLTAEANLNGFCKNGKLPCMTRRQYHKMP